MKPAKVTVKETTDAAARPPGTSTISETVADFLRRVRTDGIPDEARAAGQAILLDCLGGAIAGAGGRAARIVHEYLRESGGAGPCTVLGTPVTAAAADAGLANGLAAHLLDIDDTNSTMDGHPSPAALASSLAAAETQGASGLELITGFVIGYEVQAKVASLLPRSHWELGWHTASALGSLGAAAAAAYEFDLDHSQAVSAMGAAASMACGLCSNIGSMVKPLHPGLAARNGIVATELARRGFEAQRHALDGPLGFAQAFTGSSSFVLDPDRLAAGLGNPFDVVAPGADIKLYATCNYTHTAIDAALNLQTQGMRSPIQSVECRVPFLPRYLMTRLPNNGTEGKFSLEYCVALALTQGRLGVEDFDEGPISNADVIAVMRRVEVCEDPTISGEGATYVLPAAVTVRFQDGTSVTNVVRAPRGSTLDPVSQADMTEKFLTLCAPSLSLPQARRLLDTLRHLDRVRDVRDLRALLVPAGQPQAMQGGIEP